MHTSGEACTLPLAQVTLTSEEESPALLTSHCGRERDSRALSIAQFTLMLEKGREGLTVCM